MILEVVCKEQLELRAINQKVTMTATTPLSKDQKKLKHYNLMLGRRLTQLKNKNDECYRYIGELCNKEARNDAAWT